MYISLKYVHKLSTYIGFLLYFMLNHHLPFHFVTSAYLFISLPYVHAFLCRYTCTCVGLQYFGVCCIKIALDVTFFSFYNMHVYLRIYYIHMYVYSMCALVMIFFNLNIIIQGYIRVHVHIHGITYGS